MTVPKALVLTAFFALINLQVDAVANCKLTASELDSALAGDTSGINSSCLEDEQSVATIVTQLAFELERPADAANFFKMSALSGDKRSIIPIKLVSSFHKDVSVRHSQGLFKQPRSCEQIEQRLALYQLVSEKLNLSRTTDWEDFNLIEAYYHQLLGNQAEAEGAIDEIFENIPVSELPDTSILSDIGYELTDYQLSFYMNFFDKRRNLKRLSKDESQQHLYQAVLKERNMYEQQLKASARPKQQILCQPNHAK